MKRQIYWRRMYLLEERVSTGGEFIYLRRVYLLEESIFIERKCIYCRIG